jgi:hypothetical protein
MTSLYYSQSSNGTLCYKKQKIFAEKMKKYKTRKAGLIKGLRKTEKKTFKKIKECSSILESVKNYDSCVSKRKQSEKCTKSINLVNSNFGKCVHGISLVKMKKVKNKLNNMKGLILSTSVNKKSKKFARIQCHLITVIKILESSTNFNLSNLRNLYIRRIQNDMNKWYAEIFFDTIMNDNVFEKNLGYIFFVVDDLKNKIVMPLIDIIEEYVNSISR